MALPSANAAKNVLAYSNVNLAPLRVNVVSDDKTVTIVETIILDRTCWPVPLFYPLEDAIERNAHELAYTLLSDMECQGMGRTTRHFTGRVEMWSATLQKKIIDQLIPQLQHVAKTSKIKILKRKSPTMVPSQANNSTDIKTENEQDSSGNKKQKNDEDIAKDTREDSEKSETNEKDDAASNPDTPAPTAANRATKRLCNKASLVPVRLRLCINGVRIHDDFIWDLSVPQCPIEFARSFGEDLNLSDEAVVAVVTSIVEQLDGSTVEDTSDLDGLTGEKAARKHASAAWQIDTKSNTSNLVQLVVKHRPTA